MRRLVLLVFLTGAAWCVEVHFENKDSGFFLKHTARGVAAPEPVGAAPPPGALLSLDRFTVLRGGAPAAVRATYGPFSTKQTVPARYAVPAAPPRNATLPAPHLDVSAHPVSRELPRDAPALRVLFHAGGERHPAPRPRRACVTLHATLGEETLTATCGGEGAGEAGACLAELVLPAAWWPAEGRGKRPPVVVRLAYGASEAGDSGRCAPGGAQAAWSLGSVALVGARAGWREARAAGGDAALLLPRAPLYPHSLLHLPLVLRRDAANTAGRIVIRMKVKSGVRLVSVAGGARWAVVTELRARSATVTATLRQDYVYNETLSSEEAPEWEEIVTWLAEAVGGGAGGAGAGRLAFSVSVIPAAGVAGVTSVATPVEQRGVAHLDVEKDDIQAVLPVAKSWEVVNTAVLTGRQVSRALQVLIVSQAGRVADVTLQASCHSDDDSVLKVSSSCSSVYVDGSEQRGSSNASVIVKYGTYTGLARFTVWMPDLPLDLHMADTRLSVIKGWKVPDESSGKQDVANSLETRCRPRYQQTNVEMYARFAAREHDSGRVTWLVSRRTWLRVTELVLPHARVSDPRIATLQKNVLTGRASGRAEVQVLSPITGRVVGVREVRVAADKVSVTRLDVRVVAGLQLSIAPDTALPDGYVAETSVTRRLTAQYQEGLLDLWVSMSDGTVTALRDVPPDHYQLQVDSLAPQVVAFAPVLHPAHPRVIAVGEGSGELLRVTLLPVEQCRRSGGAGVLPPGAGTGTLRSAATTSAGALAAASAAVTVDFSADPRPDTPQNDGVRPDNARSPWALRDEPAPAVQAAAAQYHSIYRPRINSVRASSANLSPLEIGMYVLLATFCFAIGVFVVTCGVYAVRTRPVGASPPAERKAPPAAAAPTVNAHDWVWLGRASVGAGTLRITSNPLPSAMRDASPPRPPKSPPTSPLSLPPARPAVPAPPARRRPTLDSTTYCKKPAIRHRSAIEEYRPPVPPHGSPVLSNNNKPNDSAPPPPRRPRRSPLTIDAAPEELCVDGDTRMFEFDSDAPPAPHSPPRSSSRSPPAGRTFMRPRSPPRSPTGYGEVQMRAKRAKDTFSNFVEPAADRTGGSPPMEVKRATIVGNPMCSHSADGDPDLPLHDLMDYDQIMRYFHDLKESNA